MSPKWTDVLPSGRRTGDYEVFSGVFCLFFLFILHVTPCFTFILLSYLNL